MLSIAHAVSMQCLTGVLLATVTDGPFPAMVSLYLYAVQAEMIFSCGVGL